MRILIATTQVPFVRGGAEAHAEGLRDALVSAGHEAEIVAIPYKWYPPQRIPEQMLACRLLDLTESCGRRIDRVIGLKFPAYLIPHPDKVLWILHQHRSAYELWDGAISDLRHFPQGQLVRDLIRQADRRHIPEARAVYANSRTVAERLRRYCDIEAPHLYHPPPGAAHFYPGEAEDFLFYPSRINRTKRQLLVVEALALTCEPVRLRLAGVADDDDYEREVRAAVRHLGLGERVSWLGGISEAEKRDLYARSLAVLFPPLDEDYGYVTLEAMLAAKPVITCSDSGGPLEFVSPGKTGLVAAPDPTALASAMDRVWADRGAARRMGEAGLALYQDLDIGWPQVVRTLTQ